MSSPASESRPPVAAMSRSVAGRLAAVAVLMVGCAYVIGNVSLSSARRPSAHAATRSVPTHAVRLPPALRVTPQPLTQGWSVAAQVGGEPAVWTSRHGGVTLMRVNQQLVHLTLHAGSSDGGTKGWAYGDRITAAEASRIVAAVNGGFKLSYSNVGFMANGHVAVPLKAGLASIVTYTDGTTNIGAWHQGLPSSRKSVFSVLQNQRLLVDHGVASATVSSCVLGCWGGTIGLATEVARSAVGITRHGELVWAAGEHLSPAALAAAMINAGAVRAIELDINPWWVSGYLYGHNPPRGETHAAGARAARGRRRLLQTVQPRLPDLRRQLSP